MLADSLKKMCVTGKIPEKANADSLDDLGGNRDCQSELATGEAEKVRASGDTSRPPESGQ